MKTNFSTLQGRLAVSTTAVIGLTALSACDTRTASDADVYVPEQATAPQPVDGVATTLAIGEEDGGYASPSETYATTFAVGEEDGAGPFPVEPDGGIGDGAGPIPFEPGTPPIGEVEGEYERIYIPPDPDNVGQAVNSGVVTTLAIGEEG